MTNLICMQRDLNWHLSNIIEMYWFIYTIVTTTFCYEFVRNISAKIGCNPFCYYLMVLNWHCRHDREYKKNMHKFHTLQCKNNNFLLSNDHLLWRNIYTLWGSSSRVCDGQHFVLALQGMKFMHVFFIFSIVSAVPIQDH